MKRTKSSIALKPNDPGPVIRSVKKGDQVSFRCPGEGLGFMIKPAPEAGIHIVTTSGDAVFLPRTLALKLLKK